MPKPPARPALKLKLSTAPVPTQQPAEATPRSATPKIKFKLNSDPAKGATPPATTPAAKTPKEKSKKQPPPPRKILKQPKPPGKGDAPSTGSKKRAKAADDEDERAQADQGLEDERKPQFKRIKLTSKPLVPRKVVIKSRGPPPPRPFGAGYDSEASDREMDPAIEHDFILRMAPGEDCDYLRKAIEEKKIGLPLRDGGADIGIRFSDRRAALTIRQRIYAAVMVDLPCIIEGMKSWDRRNWWKAADICQMLYVIGPAPTRQAALSAPLPSTVDRKTYQFPHGLTAPLRWVRKRRFRKRVSHKTIEAVEDEVERLLAEDQTCEPGSSKYEIVDLDRMTRDNSISHENDAGFDAEYDEDADGEVDDTAYFDNANIDPEIEDEEALEADLEMAMMADDDEDIYNLLSAGTTTSAAVETPVAGIAGTAPPTTAPTAAGTPVSGIPTPSPAGQAPYESSGDDEEDDNNNNNDNDEDDNDASEEIDEDTLESQRELQRQKEEIADLENAIANETVKLSALTNPHLRNKLVMKIHSLKADLDLKRGSTVSEEE